MTGKPPKASNGSSKSNLEELRSLILGPEQTYIGALEERNAHLEGEVEKLSSQLSDLNDIISDPDNHAQSISTSLAEAMMTRHRDDENGGKGAKIRDVIAPIVEESLMVSVEDNPDKIAEAIYPIMLPSITKAIKQLFQSMIQEINKTLDQQFSPKALGWRIKALRTGKSYGEYLLSKTLTYRVEQSFLVHKETGLLLLHSSLEKSDEGDADVISAMLTAIQDFVKDSFTSEKSETLDTLNVGDLTVWVERSPFAYLAVVLRGQPMENLREELQEILLKFHSKHRHELKDYEGDNSSLLGSQPLMDRTLKSRLKSDEENESKNETNASSGGKKALWMALSLVVLSLLAYRIYRGLQWHSYVESLNNTKGVVILNEDYKNIQGLLDDGLILDINLINNNGFSEANVDFNWTRVEMTEESRNQIIASPKSTQPSN